MDITGWITMTVSLTFVVGLTLWCYAKTLSLPTDPGEEYEDE
jgi:hypothetical protein